MEKTDCLERFIGTKYKDAHLSKIELAPEMHHDLLEWLKPPIQHFLLFQGCVGCGKTWTSIAIARHLFELASKTREYPSIFFYPQERIFEEIKECYHNKTGENHLMKRYKECLVLIIDDLGVSRNNDWQVEKISEIIRERYNNQRPTIITTNLTFAQIEETFDARIRSRLEAMSNLVITEWKRDLRAEGM